MNTPVSLTDVRIDFNGLSLRSPRDDDIDALMTVYDDSFSLHPGQRSPTDPAHARQRILDTRIRRMRHPQAPCDWHLELIVETEGTTPIGWANLYPQNDSSWDALETTTWVESGRRGKHHSRTIRQALLALIFDGLGAQLAISRSQADNHSNRTSENLGYRRTSTTPGPDGYYNWFLARPHWEATRPDGIVLAGYQTFRDWLHHS